MNVTMVVFPMAVDRISVLALNTDDQRDCWTRDYTTLQQVIASLERTGIVTASEANQLQSQLSFLRGCPIIRGVVEREDLKDAGFSPVVRETIH